jgi:alpha-beta hydrolase superfamily lysophospholipase
LGIELGANAFEAGGMRVSGVIPGSMADAAGIAVGDVVESLCGVRLESLGALQDAARRAGAISTSTAVVLRHGVRAERTMLVQRRPLETNVEYGHVMCDGFRLRTLVTRPRRNGSPPKAPAVLFVQGFSRESIDFATANVAPFRELVHGWTRDGFATMRVDKRGVGDSEGEPADFVTEVADVQRALTALAELSFVNPEQVFVFGHSVGGIIAPLLRGACGFVVYGTSPLRWYDCIEASRDRQRALRGLDKTDAPIERTAYETQLHETDIAAAWSAIEAPVLVLHGEHDWVVGEDEARAVASSAKHAEVRVVPGLDHLMTHHASRDDSLRDYGLGPRAGRHDHAVLDATTTWMRDVLAHSV